MLSEEVLKNVAKVTSLLNIEVLNLHDNGLTKVKELQSLPLLKKLILSFNELTRLDDVSQLVCYDIGNALCHVAELPCITLQIFLLLIVFDIDC